MTKSHCRWLLIVVAVSLSAIPALAQRFKFEQTYRPGSQATLDIETRRGEVRVTGTDSQDMLIRGTVTVRFGWNVPENAVEIARQVAAAPPVKREGESFRLGEPSSPIEQRAVTVSYEVQLPRRMALNVRSVSGAVTVDGIQAPVAAQTQSGAIRLSDLGAAAQSTTGSGAVKADGVSGLLRVQTGSGSIQARDLRGGLHAKTISGAVDGAFNGEGAVNVRTQSSGVLLQGVLGDLDVLTGSGRARISGAPVNSWSVSTGSGAVDLDIDAGTPVTVDVTTGSGSVKVDGLQASGVISKRRMVGTLAGGGARLNVTSRSGSIRIQ